MMEDKGWRIKEEEKGWRIKDGGRRGLPAKPVEEELLQLAILQELITQALHLLPALAPHLHTYSHNLKL